MKTLRDVERGRKELLAVVESCVESYSGGDRPPSPLAWLLKLRSDLRRDHAEGSWAALESADVPSTPAREMGGPYDP